MRKMTYGLLLAVAASSFMGCAPETATDTVDAEVAAGSASEGETMYGAKGESDTASGPVQVFDGSNAMIGFKGSKPDGSSHVGGFKEFKCSAMLSEDGSKVESIVVEIKTPSLYSDNEKLTGHLKNIDFFNVNEYPTAKFETKSLEPIEGEADKYTVKGELTMLGVTKPVEFPAMLKMVDGKVMMESAFVLDRTEFGMNYGEGKINPGVDMTIALGKTAESTAE